MKPISIVILLFPVYLAATPPDTIINGVAVKFGYSTFIFPQSWKEAPINAKGEAIAIKEISRCKKVMTAALNKYPAVMLRKNIKTVYFLKSMEFFDVGYGGTNSTADIYLTNDGTAQGYTDSYLEQTFHHEFSSILLRNYMSKFDTTGWITANDKNFTYNDPENGVGAIRNNTSSQDLDTSICKRGMLTQYAMSGMENDVNTFAQNLFCPEDNFWAIVDKYPSVRKKTIILIKLYHYINPVFTESYFRKFDKKKTNGNTTQKSRY